MGKRKEYMRKAIIILVVGCLAILLYSNISQRNEVGWYKQQANESFRSSLALASANFSIDFEGNLEDELFKHEYKDAIANIATASKVVLLSDYHSTNQSLNITLHRLYKFMEIDKNIAVVEKNYYLLYENLLKLSANPNDMEATKILEDFVATL